MNQKVNKIVSLLMVIVLIVGNIYFPVSSAQTNDISKYDGLNQYFTSATFKYKQMNWAEFKTYYGVPLDTNYKNKDNYLFNIELWLDNQIVVYGDYSKVGENDFKNATLNGYSGDLTIGLKNKGYYKNGTLLGERRYHGFDASGNRYVNLNFPADADSGRKPEQKNWIYRIWDKKSSYYKITRIEEPSSYFDIASLDGFIAIDVRNWIEETLPFDITNSTYAADKKAYNYAHVTTAPSTRFPGEALMYHQSDIVYYQTFSLNKMVSEKSLLVLKPYIAATKIGDVETLDKKVDLKYSVKLTGIYQDNELWDPYTTYGGMPVEVARTIYYTRDEIKSWTLTLNNSVTGVPIKVENLPRNGNKQTNTFDVTIPYSAYKDKLKDGKLDIAFNGEVTVYFYNGDSIKVTVGTTTNEEEAPIIEDIDERGNQETTPPTLMEKIKLSISAPKYMLDTEKFKIVDGTNRPDGSSRKVTLEGDELSEADADAFLGGQHIFPLLGKDKIYTYEITYTDAIGNALRYSSYVVVYTTKPRAQFKTVGTFKENRKINVTVDNSVNSSYLSTHTSFNILNFDATSDVSNSLRFRTKNTSTMEFLVKNESQLALNMKIETVVPSNLIERSDIPSEYFVSEDYNQSYRIDKDYKPAIVANVWSSVMIRNESLDFAYDGASYDDDIISVNNYKILYDENQDTIPEKVVKQGKWSEYNGFVADKLGTYKIVFDIEESFGQETLSEFITAIDTRKTTAERIFYVDNVSPVTDMETDITVNIPKVDLMVLNDQGITRELNTAIKDARVNWINKLQQSKGVSANLQIWDMYTYTDSQAVSPSKHTGGAYPSATWLYTSGGYSGTINLVNVRDNGGWYDNGYMQSYTSCVETPVYGWNGDVDCADHPPYICDVIIRYDKVCTVDYEWVSDYEWESNYYGDYQGVITKQTKQTFNPTLEITSNKYIVYFTNGTINTTDLNYVKNKATSKVILVSDASAKPLTPHYAWIDRNQTLDKIIEQVNAVIENDESLDNKKLLLVNQTFNTYFMNFDRETDSILNLGLQYLHDPNYYDNGQGMETGTVATYSDSSFISQAVKTKFSKPGKFTIYSRIKDIIPGYGGFEEFSNVASVDIYVHRKPIADYTLDWDYNTATSTYKTTWVDKSYDLDHQYSDAQKGIRDRKIMYRKTSGDNLWIYAIPDNLTIGTYELKYIVKDIEGVWSDEITRMFTLSAEPPIRVEAILKATDNSFNLNALPASESITLYEIITRYHRAHSLKISLINASNQTLLEKALLLSTSLPINNINGNVYKWLDAQFQTGSAFPDGIYRVKVVSISTAVPIMSETLYLPFAINTPISIEGELSDMTAGETVTIRAMTSKYAKSATVTLFNNTSHSKTISLIKSQTQPFEGVIIWETSYMIPTSIPEGDYTHLFTAWTDSGKSANDTVTKKLNVLSIESLDIQGYWNHWRGQTDIFGVHLTNQPHRFLSYEKIRITAMVLGNPDKVVLRLSPELESMQYTNSLGQHYRYIDEIGNEVSFPLNMTKSTDATGNPNLSKWTADYILPLCRETMTYDNVRRTASYWLKADAHKGSVIKSETITDIDMTGNIYDLIYTQPSYK